MEIIPTARIDAEYFRPRFDGLIGRVQQQSNHMKLGAVLAFCERGEQPIYDEIGLPVINSKHVQVGKVLLSDDNRLGIVDEDSPQIHKGDVLINGTGVGTIGRVAPYMHDTDALPDNHVTILRAHTDSGFDPLFLSIQLGGSVGQLQSEQHTRGSSGQVELYPQDIRKFWVWRGSPAFQTAVRVFVEQAYALREKAPAFLDAAEQALLHILCLDAWQPPEPLTYVRRASEVTGGPRFDAEFHAPRYASLQAVLAKRFVLKSLGTLGEVLKGDTVPYSDDGTIPIIRSGDLRDIDDDDRFLRATPDAEIFELQRGDILISSIGFGSIGKVQVFDKPGRYGTVGEVTVIRQKELNPYYVAAYLRSRFGQMLIARYITGATGQLHLYAKDVAKIFVPVIPPSQQTIFEENAKAAREARREAQALLARAQRAVEVAIEQGEGAAMALLS
ncbi:MAG: restriction endonuclease subunit S [Opitutaceae bacterium]